MQCLQLAKAECLAMVDLVPSTHAAADDTQVGHLIDMCAAKAPLTAGPKR